MKKIFLVILLLFLTCIPVSAKNKSINAGSLLLEKNLYKLANDYDKIYNLNILNQKYTCYNNNCYDLDSFKYNKLTKTSYINMIIDLMDWNAHEEYPSPYSDGYISHLIFQAKLHSDKLSVKCIGFVVGEIVVDYEDGIASSAQYNIIAIHKRKPAVIKNIKDFEDTFYNWTDINALTHLLKTW